MSEKITFKELVELIAKQSEQSQSSTNSFITELVQIIESGLKSSGSVSISGFGKFELRWMNERMGTNPQTGEEITIPGQNKVVFKPYKALREDVNAPYAGLKSRIIREETEIFEPAVPVQKSKDSSETIDDLIIEHDNPHFVKPEKPKKKTPVTAPLPNEAKLAEEVQKSGSFKWSYAAAVIIALIAFIALFFMIQRGIDTTETPTTTPQIEQVTPPVVSDEEPADVAEPEPPDTEPQTEFETTSFTVEPGQSLWTIAENQLGNPYLWPLLYNLNQDILTNPNQLPAASDLQIPEISDPENLNEFEREQVALGYFALYEWNLENNPDEARYFLWAVGVFSPELLDQPPSDVDPDDLAFARNR